MNFDPNSAATRRHVDARHILLAAAAIAAAVFLPFLSVAKSEQRTGTVVASTAAPAAPSFAQPTADAPRSPSTDRGHSRFFGFLEYDWDPDAPGGVPGFDPWPGTQQRP